MCSTKQGFIKYLKYLNYKITYFKKFKINELDR